MPNFLKCYLENRCSMSRIKYCISLVKRVKKTNKLNIVITVAVNDTVSLEL